MKKKRKIGRIRDSIIISRHSSHFEISRKSIYSRRVTEARSYRSH